MTDDGISATAERWLSIATTIAAPATGLSALLFYFGYVSSRAQYAYFGIDVDTIGLSTRDYVMRSPQPLLVPLLLMTVGGIGLVLAHTAIRHRIARTAPGPLGAGQLERYRRLTRRATVAGLVLLGAGLVVLLAYPVLQDWPQYGLVTPLLLAVGAGVVAYTARIRGLLHPPPPTSDAASPRSPALAHLDNTIVSLRRLATVLIVVVVLANMFWATATIAQWAGRGLAKSDATHLDRFPSVILDTQERLYLRDPGVQETSLPVTGTQHFRYRYRHLRLLIQGSDRMFLVPDTWSASNSTLMVPLDSSVHVQFQFQNDPP